MTMDDDIRALQEELPEGVRGDGTTSLLKRLGWTQERYQSVCQELANVGKLTRIVWGDGYGGVRRPSAVLSTKDDLIAYLKESGVVLWTVLDDEAVLYDGGTLDEGRLASAVHVMSPAARHVDDPRHGVAAGPFELRVTNSLSEELKALSSDDVLWRHTTLLHERSFVYVDISDFSRMHGLEQQQVISALIRVGRAVLDLLRREMRAVAGGRLSADSEEAQLCIGDGYIYVHRDPIIAAVFSALLAHAIESEVANRSIREFQFRVGVHEGPIRFFWDPGRQAYNYVGDGINDANRVLTAVGKDADDVVYVSAAVRQRVLTTPNPMLQSAMLPNLENRGRRPDKHGKLHRVYLLNHVAVARYLLEVLRTT